MHSFTPTTAPASSIEMLTPAETGARLGLDDHALLDLVNAGRLPAYNLGGSIRFKVVDVNHACAELIAA